MSKHFGNRRGSVLLIVLFAMVGVLGMGAMVIDGGQLYFEAAKLQTAVDAAALAGARSLAQGVTAAQQLALSTAEQNGVPNGEITITVDSVAGTVTAKAVRTVHFGLARIIGFESAPVSATATAGSYTVNALRGLAPLGVIWQDFVMRQQYDLKVGSGGTTGNYGALALGGTGSSNYRDNLMYGYNSMVTVNDLIPTEPGNISGPTTEAITWRINNCTHGCTFDNRVSGCTRILLVPIINGLPNGRGEVTVLGFASFFMEEYLGDAFVRGRFIEMNVQGAVGPSGDYGVRTVKLSN